MQNIIISKAIRVTLQNISTPTPHHQQTTCSIAYHIFFSWINQKFLQVPSLRNIHFTMIQKLNLLTY